MRDECFSISTAERAAAEASRAEGDVARPKQTSICLSVGVSRVAASDVEGVVVERQPREAPRGDEDLARRSTTLQPALQPHQARQADSRLLKGYHKRIKGIISKDAKGIGRCRCPANARVCCCCSASSDGLSSSHHGAPPYSAYDSGCSLCCSMLDRSYSFAYRSARGRASGS